MTKAVLFDAAHTLMYVTPSVGEVYAEVAARYGVCVAPEALERAFRVAFKSRAFNGDAASLATSEAIEFAWWRALVTQVYQSACPGDPFGDRFDDYFAAQFERFAAPDVWALYDDVLPCLAGLEAMGVSLGIVSNWDGRLLRLMADWDVGRYFTTIVTSAEAGYRKPHGAPFRLALERLGLAAEEALFVGDSQREDCDGAEGAGMRAVRIERGAAGEQAGVIGSLDALPAIIRSSSGRRVSPP